MDDYPGNKLEDFVLYRLNAIIDTRHTDPIGFRRKYDSLLEQPTIFSQEQFAIVLELFEPYRQAVEHCLARFNNVDDSWKSYSQFSFIFIPSTVFLRVQQLVCSNFGK